MMERFDKTAKSQGTMKWPSFGKNLLLRMNLAGNPHSMDSNSFLERSDRSVLKTSRDRPLPHPILMKQLFLSVSTWGVLS